MEVISLINQKGGVGKTISSINIAAGLAMFFNKKVLLVDIDPQSSATLSFGIRKESVKNSSYDVIVGNCGIRESITKTGISNLDICPANKNLVGLNLELVSEISREDKLKDSLEPIKNEYDFIIIDCPPSLDLITLNAMVASDSCLIPLQLDLYSADGFNELKSTVMKINKKLNPNLKIKGLFFTLVSQNCNLHRDMESLLREKFKDNIYTTKIPKNVKIPESINYSQNIFEYAKSSTGAIAYLNLIKEIFNLSEETGG